ATASQLHMYPDGSAPDLKAAIGDAHGLDPARILCGNSSDELLHLLALTFSGPGDEVLMSQHGFLAYPIVARAAGAVPVKAPEVNLTASVENLLRAVTPRTKIIFLANPNNPTGSYLPSAEIRRLQRELPPRVLLVLDAAYAEYVRLSDYENGLAMALSLPNVVMTRTFSKIYALAGLRIGWMVGSAAVLDAVNRIRGPFNVSIPAQAAGAAAMRDHAHLEASFSHNAKWVPKLTAALTAMGLRVHPSVCNFVLIEFPADGPHTAQKADAFLTARGLILRGVGGYGLPQCLRLSVGGEEANELVLEALGAFMASGS
ncbi:MAG TPA: histidinol-phosphate transaminase, partial [Alphaproteobacteria bacterium]|nr:histidinol-phosphate transaminase [Alphaproteobacteria bacterium]